MEQERIRQVDLQNYSHISSLTFLQMRRGECVPLESFIKICEYLDCDFGVIMTVNAPQADLFDPIKFTMNIKAVNRVFRAALKDFMNETGISINDVSKISGISLNAVKQIFEVKSSVSHNSLLKLNALGYRYLEITIVSKQGSTSAIV